ncbi:Protein-glutamine gamma-glutamyltransferase [Rubripirellula lacrimiformis]|uniref:Protein-glutamine gamma-glutamyltransferase n=1 Tax=Rubripirellula lacrimiformis TaxID=1930273 RepID=A0A517NAX3_9BACT|nr:transglutaminaseTgpA domain-containing protein [Rubripirellula lacrimiformis]QDT04280.1 Protein-glutamine gamma-glutamyltransferase [Rubripirellula lacrimiformis]
MSDQTAKTDQDSRRIGARLKFYFAVLSCLGGLVLTSGTSMESVTAIAVFLAVFGYVFVDWLELFALPPIAAYAAMGLAALYCVSDFADFDAAGNHQMEAVAQLLVFVQGILMLQRKTRRILEQLGVFCMLELVVAAVFNNAINFGLLLIPIGIVAAWALSSLSAVSASDGLLADTGLDDDDDDGVGPSRRSKTRPNIQVSAPDSVAGLFRTATRLPRIAMFAVAPSVLIVGAIFFYALPRTTQAARGISRGNALVGFSDKLRLEQIGQMMQSSAIAMRVKLTDRATGTPYKVNDGFYLRGRVMERYTPQFSGRKTSATWSELGIAAVLTSNRLPREFITRRSTDENFFDAVNVSVVCESSRSSALFAVAPYFHAKKDSDIDHCWDRWTLQRSDGNGMSFPRMTYNFGTHAFNRGNQSDLTAYQVADVPLAGRTAGASETTPSSGTTQSSNLNRNRQGRQLGDRRDALDQAERRRAQVNEQQRIEGYISDLLQFDRESIPTAESLATRLARSVDGNPVTDYRAARNMERYFASSGEFQYTLNLDAETYPGMDPIEQFLLIDKRGHCQYFSSALVMMLRSQNIPARVVVGYHTDEYNEIGSHYVARQLHAHAWVEALIDRDQLDDNRTVYGQPESEKYWLRLDPTPGTGRTRTEAGGVGQVFDMAQSMWDDYVVDMDGSRQEQAFLGSPAVNPLHRSYAQFVERLSTVVGRVRAGELGGGSLASGNLFSWPAAVLGFGLALLAVILFRLPTPAWVRRRMGQLESNPVARPSIDFYRQTLDQLERIGIYRKSAQTPNELAVDATERFRESDAPSDDEPLSILTDAFYRLRFGRPGNRDSQATLEGPTASGHLDGSAGFKHDPGQETDKVQLALAALTQRVDRMVISQETAEQNK